MAIQRGDSQHVRTAFDDLSHGVPKVGTSRVDPVVRSVGRKLLRTTMSTSQSMYGLRRSVNTDATGLFTRISQKTTVSIVDARNAMQLLPDIELAMNLLVTSILSPKDMNTIEITYSLRNKVIRSETAKRMIDVLRTHFETHHNLKEMLTPALEDMLVKTGSYPLLVLAENTVDQIINGQQAVTMESLKGELDQSGAGFRPVGFLGNPVEPSKNENKDSLGLESLANVGQPLHYSAESVFVPNLLISDNSNILKLSSIRERMRSDAVNRLLRRSKLRTTMETHTSADELVESLYRSRTYIAERQINVPSTGSTGRPTIGHPLVLKLPSESVIPVHEPSNPTKHLGYFIMIDPAGNPIFKATEADYYQEMTANYSVNQSMVSSVLREAKRVQLGLNIDVNNSDVNQLERIYGDLVEYELNSRLKRGIYGSGATAARPEEVYRIMLARALAGKMTQLLYVPEDMLIYMAFDYNQYGVGVSLLQKSIILAGQRANLSVASVMAELKNAVSRTKLLITLDEEDDDPSGTVEHIITEHAKLRQGSYPMSIYAPNDIINFLQNAAVDIEVNGNTGYPSTKVDVSDYNSNKVVPNMDLQKDLRDRQSWAFGIPPELIDTARGADFATSIVTNNLMLIKNVMRRQQQFTPLLEEFVRVYVLSDGILLDQLREILRESDRDPSTDGIVSTVNTARDQIGGSQGDNIDRQIVDFLTDLKIDLPKPEGAKTDNLSQAYDKQKEFLTKALDEYLSDGAISYELSGEIGAQGDALKNALSAMFMRRWLRDNGVLPELDELVQLGENDSPGLDLMAEIEAHTSPMKVNLRDFIVKYLRRKAADDAVLQTVETQLGTEVGGSAGGSTETSSDDTGDGGGGGSDDGGFGADFGDFDTSGGDKDEEEDGGEGSETSESSSSETSTSSDGSTTTKSESSSSSSSSSSM